MLNSQLDSFICDNLEFADSYYISAHDLMSYYKTYTGSTSGKKKLYAELTITYNVQKISNAFLGVRMSKDSLLAKVDASNYGQTHSEIYEDECVKHTKSGEVLDNGRALLYRTHSMVIEYKAQHYSNMLYK